MELRDGVQRRRSGMHLIFTTRVCSLTIDKYIRVYVTTHTCRYSRKDCLHRDLIIQHIRIGSDSVDPHGTKS